MAGLRISQLPSASAIASADLLPFSSVAGSETRRIQANVLAVALGLLGTSVGSTAPTSPSNGQLWVDTSSNPPLVKVWNGATWTIVSFQPTKSVITSPGSTAPSSPALGQLWQDTSQTPDELKMWDGSNWVRPDPDGITQTAGDARYLQITTASSTYLPLAGGTMTGDLTLTGAPTTNNMASTKKYVDDQIAAIPAADVVPAGTVIWTARNTAPTGYVICDGSLKSRTTYASLFAAIGTTFGAGDGSTTFGVPDLRGEFVRGWNSGANDQGGTSTVDSGRAFGSNQTEMIGPHTHPISDPGHNHSYQGGDRQNLSGTQSQPVAQGNNTTGSATTGITINNNSGTENRPRNVALLACIKT